MARSLRFALLLGVGFILLAAHASRAQSAPDPAAADEDDRPLDGVTPIDEIVVTASRYSILREDPVASVDLGREDILQLPHLFDDLYRAVTVLPGTSSSEISGRFHVRGGLHREMQVQLDGLELYEPFHLKDFQGVFTIFDPEALGGVDLITGGFPAEYGDRMSGVLDMATLFPNTRRHAASISFTTAEASTAGTYAKGRGTWLASLRRGYLDVVLNFVDGDNDFSPRYWDALAKTTYELTGSQNLAFNALYADDSLDIEQDDDPFDIETAQTEYGSAYAWLNHQAVLGTKTVVQSTLSASRVDRDRNAFFVDYEERFDLTDERQLDVFALKQGWSHQPTSRNYLKWGFDLRSLEADYDYFNDRVIDPVLAEIRNLPPAGTTVFVDSFTGEQYSAYAADRLRFGQDLTVELGLRWDEQTLTGDNQVSPRANLVWAAGSGNVLRFAWGHFHQSQRPYELQVEDGETGFFGAERAEHLVLGWERALADGITLGIDAYQRRVKDPRPRYETLFDPFSPFPEIEPDRVLIAPASSEAEGVEVFLRRQGHERFNWWVHYTWSSVDDEIDGVSVPRRIDQEHALVVDVNLRLGRQWNLNLAWRYHTGWPTTELSGDVTERPDGSLVITPVVGPFYAEKLPDYHRLDLRASRSWQRKRGRLSFFADLQNVYDRKNLRGFDVESSDFRIAPDGQLVIVSNEEEWLGMIPSFGIGWEF